MSFSSVSASFAWQGRQGIHPLPIRSPAPFTHFRSRVVLSGLGHGQNFCFAGPLGKNNLSSMHARRSVWPNMREDGREVPHEAGRRVGPLKFRKKTLRAGRIRRNSVEREESLEVPPLDTRGVVAIARQLQLLSEYPLVLLTDVESFLDGTSIAKLHVLGVNVMPLEHLEPPRKLEHSRWRVAWWKMQIWKLTQYERLIWLDSDAVLYRSVDYLFERPWMYAQQDDWFCKFKKAGMHMCSGIMLLFPNISDFYGLRDCCVRVYRSCEQCST